MAEKVFGDENIIVSDNLDSEVEIGVENTQKSGYWQIFNNSEAETVKSDFNASDYNVEMVTETGNFYNYVEGENQDLVLSLLENASFTQLDGAGISTYLGTDLVNSESKQVLDLEMRLNSVSESGENHSVYAGIVAPDNDSDSALFWSMDYDTNECNAYVMQADGLSDTVAKLSEDYGWSESYGETADVPWKSEEFLEKESEAESEDSEKTGIFAKVQNFLQHPLHALQANAEDGSNDYKTDKDKYFDHMSGLIASDVVPESYSEFQESYINGKYSHKVFENLQDASFSPDANGEEREGNPRYSLLITDENYESFGTLDVYEDGCIGYRDEISGDYFSVHSDELSETLSKMEDDLNLGQNVEHSEANVYSIDNVDEDMSLYANAETDEEYESSVGSQIDSKSSLEEERFEDKSARHESYVDAAIQNEKNVVDDRSGHSNIMDYEAGD